MERLTDNELIATLFTAKCGAAGTNDGELKGSYARCMVAALTELQGYRSAATGFEGRAADFLLNYFKVDGRGSNLHEALAREFAAIAGEERAKERERCTRICDDYGRDGSLTRTYECETADEIAVRIRADDRDDDTCSSCGCKRGSCPPVVNCHSRKGGRPDGV